jgi:hypothetical protein
LAVTLDGPVILSRDVNELKKPGKKQIENQEDTNINMDKKQPGKYPQHGIQHDTFGAHAHARTCMLMAYACARMTGWLALRDLHQVHFHQGATVTGQLSLANLKASQACLNPCDFNKKRVCTSNENNCCTSQITTDILQVPL